MSEEKLAEIEVRYCDKTGADRMVGIRLTNPAACGIIAAATELQRATKLYGPFNNQHEGYAILLEEVDELWDEVKKNPKSRSVEKMRDEAIQIAAMALRFVNDVCG